MLERIKEYLSEEYHDPDFFQFYSFANENINGYMQHFKLREKSLLTVGSSSDQMINATLAGCRDITVVDICPLTKIYYYLKLASLLTLKREEFINFLIKKECNIQDDKDFLLNSTFQRVKTTLKLLDEESYSIWDYLFQNYGKEDIQKLFRSDINDLQSILYCNRYLKNDYNYTHVRETIMSASIDFVIQDITKLSMNRCYDNLWLSNVAHHLNGQEIEKMILKSMKLLKENGKL